ncbi:AraC family transcriptional regulator [Paenibacillus psychroresistens]|uniref:AraC family transcriptional regulator n=1 Tax=Paenibacillus psychroresistens TaxID=1778678 RepID=A0A6B8RMK5_9BACL|nr:AraC family transcriptional regulator [Paenibacillus psychroresistens]QGQ96783.1 AraC family transcriptional regulator [Paenibacillus psychroresistens]
MNDDVMDLDLLLQNAVLNIIEFDINTRHEMKTYNRVRPCYVMSYHKKGNAKLRIGDEIYAIVPGTVILIPPNVPHDHFKENADESVFLWSHFTFEIAGVIDVLKLFQIPITFKLRDSVEFEKVFMQYNELKQQTGFLPRTILRKAKALELIYLVLESAIRMDQDMVMKIQSRSFLEILARIIQNPEQDFTLAHFAKELNMHPTYISNRFKELYGRSPIQVQREMKIHKAKTLLKTTQLSITEIAQSLGFIGIPNFTRLFKLYVGTSPSHYREINKNKINGYFSKS